VVLCILGLIALIRHGAPGQSAGPTSSQPIRITSPYEEPHIASVSGTGDIPQGQHLRLFVYAPGIGLYYPQDDAYPTSSDQWTASHIYLAALATAAKYSPSMRYS
jgi:hypothetical protein